MRKILRNIFVNKFTTTAQNDVAFCHIPFGFLILTFGFMLMLISISGCATTSDLTTSMLGGGGGGDTTAPTVSSTSPTDSATSVAITSNVTGTFSETMTESTITSSTFSLQTGTTMISGTVSYDATTKKATLNPDNDLANNTLYTATINKSVKDSAGNQMSTNYSWSFTTAAASDTTAPTVSSTSPIDNATSVEITSNITASFSEAMDSSTITSVTFFLRAGATNGPSVSGNVSFNSSTKTATFTPSANLSSSTSCFATITIGVKDSAGNALATNKNWGFTTAASAGVSGSGNPGATWTQATSNAPLSNTTYHTSVVFNNKIWIIEENGWTFYSTDGLGWYGGALNAFSTRLNFASTVFDNKMWVIGGTVNGSYVNDVFYSSDGISWTQAATPAFSARSQFVCLSYDNKIWVLGGRGNSSNVDSEVWYSIDGVNWTLATSQFPEVNRGLSSHSAVVFNNKMWVIFDTIAWYSTDGNTWTRATSNAGFQGRNSHTSVAFDNKIWVIAGVFNNVGRNDVWYSSDGVTWTPTASSAQFSIRWNHSSVVYNNKMWVIGGQSLTGALSDVWWSN